MSFKNIIERAKTWLSGKPIFLVNPQAPIKVAFVSNGTTYYMFEDIFSMPCQRALEATTFYEEMKSRISSEYLGEYIDAMTNALSIPEINLNRIVLLVNTLKERNDLIVDSDIVFKLASVMYFDKNESPYKFDMKYNHLKIKRWKANNDVAAFFLSTPIKSFLPFTNILEKDLRTYLKTAEAIKTAHLELMRKK